VWEREGRRGGGVRAAVASKERGEGAGRGPKVFESERASEADGGKE
jgi:hypothetical protein